MASDLAYSNHFLISDSFYRMEYETPKHSVFDIYNIGIWNISVIKKHKAITPIELLIYFNELIKFCPWLYIKKTWISTEEKPSMFENIQMFIDFNIDVLQSHRANKKMEWDIGTFECGLNLSLKGNNLSLSRKNEVLINASFDPEYCVLSFSIDFRLDVFFENPSRQPNVILPDHYAKANRNNLEISFRGIESSSVFVIDGFQSDFYPDSITKYGFSEKVV
jgi:hypothetical protein